MEWLKHWLDWIVFGVLGSMSFVVVWLTVERWLSLRSFDLQKFAREPLLEVALTRNLTLIATIGANAPYVGLLGTVLGIMISFYDISQSGQIDTISIMLGLALALKATAAGIGVAIPAMISYNLLERRTEVLLQQWRAAQPDPAKA